MDTVFLNSNSLIVGSVGPRNKETYIVFKVEENYSIEYRFRRNDATNIEFSEGFTKFLESLYSEIRKISIGQVITIETRIDLDTYLLWRRDADALNHRQPHFFKHVFKIGSSILFFPEGKSVLSLVMRPADQRTFADWNKERVKDNKIIDHALMNDYLRWKNFDTTQIYGEDLRDDLLQIASNILNVKGWTWKDVDVKRMDKFVDSRELKIRDDLHIPIAELSSGQREVYSTILYLLYFVSQRFHFFGILEEPEAHLFPPSQKSMVELLAYSLNSAYNVPPENPGCNQLLLTTHSPYILSAFNNLLYAWQVGQQKPEEVSKIIPRELWIDPARVGAYFVDNGTIRSIMDEELQQIKAEEIDGASREINATYDQLFEIGHL
jgi:hypothetical protein